MKISYKFYYDDENEITFLCMGENIETKVAFSYLQDLKKKFLLTYDLKNAMNSFSYQLKDFSDDIKRMANSYMSNPDSKISQLKNGIIRTNEILHENVEKLLQKSEKLNIIAQKSNRLMYDADNFVKNIHEINKRQRIKKYKYIALIFAFLIIVTIFIYLISK